MSRPIHGGPKAAPALWKVLAAFAAVYFIWGSTYLAIRWGIEGFPPFFMAGVRSLMAGGALYWFVRWRDGRRVDDWGVRGPTANQWKNAAIVGGLLLVGGNGLVTWAEQYVPSSLAAVLVALLPMWMVLLEAARRGGTRPTLPVVTGVACGLFGVLLLVGPADALAGAGWRGWWSANESVHPLGALALLVSSFCWASGSLYSRRVDLPPSPFLATGMELLCGGGLLLVVSALTGEFADLSWARMTATPGPVLALLYLTVFGSIIGFTAYIWLLGVTTPARVATYAYVNPVVAVAVGWALGGEALTGRMLAAAAVIVAGVAVIVTFRERGARPPSAALNRVHRRDTEGTEEEKAEGEAVLCASAEA